MPSKGGPCPLHLLSKHPEPRLCQALLRPRGTACGHTAPALIPLEAGASRRAGRCQAIEPAVGALRSPPVGRIGPRAAGGQGRGALVALATTRPRDSAGGVCGFLLLRGKCWNCSGGSGLVCVGLGMGCPLCSACPRLPPLLARDSGVLVPSLMEPGDLARWCPCSPDPGPDSALGSLWPQALPRQGHTGQSLPSGASAGREGPGRAQVFLPPVGCARLGPTLQNVFFLNQSQDPLPNLARCFPGETPCSAGGGLVLPGRGAGSRRWAWVTSTDTSVDSEGSIWVWACG